MATRTITPGRIVKKLYQTSPEDLVEVASRRYGVLARRRTTPPLTAEFLRSQAYQDLMNRYVPYDGQYGLHEAETATKSFLYRAFEAEEQLRAWRWRGVQENLDLIIDLVDDPSKLVVDLGGAASSFGLGAVIVDQLPFDADGRKVPYASLSELPRKADVIISSHTLEHIPDLEAELARISDSLAPGGTFLAHVPAFSCERWRVGTHSHASFGDHVWTFGLSGTPNVPAGLINYVDFDAMLARHFTVVSAEYCGDNSIFAVARRPLEAPADDAR
jgi:SAM-dependent methyltransferase